MSQPTPQELESSQHAWLRLLLYSRSWFLLGSISVTLLHCACVQNNQTLHRALTQSVDPFRTAVKFMSASCKAGELIHDVFLQEALQMMPVCFRDKTS